jgi:hypothetical protein
MTKDESIKQLENQMHSIPELRAKWKTVEFDKWKRRTRLIIEKIFGVESSHLNEFDKIKYGLIAYSKNTPDESLKRAYLNGLEIAQGLIESLIDEIKDFGLPQQEIDEISLKNNNAKSEKIFISHSSSDAHFGKAIVQLLRDLGLKREQIVFTSDDNYGIPLDDNIFEYLKKQILNGVYILYLLSDNYYSRVACLNEMGAAWIVQSQYSIIAVPGFEFSNPKFSEGAIDPRRMGFAMNNYKRIVEFKNNILRQFSLVIDEADWMEIYKKYCETIENLSK